MLRTTLTVLLLASTPLIAPANETSTAEDFQELGELLVGRWKSDIKFISDWPKEEKGRGERVVGYANFSYAADRHVVLGTETGGNNIGQWMLAFNGVTKQIRLIIAGSAGSVIEATVWKKSEGRYGVRVTAGGQADGKALGGVAEWVFTDGNKTLTMQGKITLEGKDLDPYKDVYTRLSPLN
jgi:hypothetical protein